MPPEVFHSHCIVTQKTPLLSRVSSRSRFKQILHQKYYQGGGGRMKFAKRKLIPILLFILLTASVWRFLKITMITTSSTQLPLSALPPTHQHKCSGTSICRNDIETNASSLTEKETRFLLQFFSQRIPCNLLIFGPEHQYSNIASLNNGGFTIFLEENLKENSRLLKPTNNTRVYQIQYNTVASDAYQLLKVARENPECKPEFNLAKALKCNLGLSNLPNEVYDTMWDVVVVDGPRGDRPDSPGRMAAIYTASILARRGNVTHVVVHDVDRMIEKWFSREFLCEENLVSSKGRFWHFQILGIANETRFCAT